MVPRAICVATSRVMVLRADWSLSLCTCPWVFELAFVCCFSCDQWGLFVASVSQCLVKHYEMKIEYDEEDPFSFDGPQIIGVSG